jgi:CelD/BcsL family acetyltransferase involved in cellulose biosynthesis
MLHVLTKNGDKLFSGSRHAVKQFIRKNKIKNYVLKERFVEKVAATQLVEPEEVFEEIETFNVIFDDDD